MAKGKQSIKKLRQMEASRGVFRPSWEEFSNFYTYVPHVQNVQFYDGNDLGFAKIHPPEGWSPYPLLPKKHLRPSTNDDQFNLIGDIKIHSPIVQTFSGKKNHYLITNTPLKKFLNGSSDETMDESLEESLDESLDERCFKYLKNSFPNLIFLFQYDC